MNCSVIWINIFVVQMVMVQFKKHGCLCCFWVCLMVMRKVFYKQWPYTVVVPYYKLQKDYMQLPPWISSHETFAILICTIYIIQYSTFSIVVLFSGLFEGKGKHVSTDNIRSTSFIDLQYVQQGCQTQIHSGPK